MDSSRVIQDPRNPRIGMIQINLGKGRAATNALLRILEEDNVAIAATQEPHVREGKVVGLGGLSALSRGRVPRAAILYTRNVKPIMIGHLSDEYLVAAEFTEETGESWYLVSVYIPPVENKTVDFNRRVGRLEEVVAELSNRGEVIIAGDFNAKSVAWGSPRDCPRGRRLCEAVETLDLVTMNRGDRPTFEGPRGTSHIDVTMATPGISARIRGWEVRDDKLTGTSDHMVIQWGLEPAGVARVTSDTTGWCVKKADWGVFRQHLGREANNMQAMLEGLGTEQ